MESELVGSAGIGATKLGVSERDLNTALRAAGGDGQCKFGADRVASGIGDLDIEGIASGSGGCAAENAGS